LQWKERGSDLRIKEDHGMKTLHVVPHSHRSGISRELELLLLEACFDRQCVRVACLGGNGPTTTRWRAAGLEVETLAWRRLLDLRPLLTLAAQVREFQPDVIIVWGLEALRAVRLAAPKTTALIAVRGPIPSNRRSRPDSQAPLLSRWERWLLRGADSILAGSNAEALWCLAAGLSRAAVRVVVPGVRPLPAPRVSDKPRIVCAGSLEPHKGFYEAIWAFDMLQFVNDDVELVIAGDGPQRGRLMDYANKTGLGHRIHLPGELPDIAPLLAQASLVWVPSQTDCGSGVALEAMAAGVPVVACRWPGLAEIVVDDETGVLIDPRNKMELARQTRFLLDDGARRRQLGEAGRRRATQVFSAEKFVETWNLACKEAA
jgi:glycosyltransferase involved in cell wall biosynthesis